MIKVIFSYFSRWFPKMSQIKPLTFSNEYKYKPKPHPFLKCIIFILFEVKNVDNDALWKGNCLMTDNS